MKRVAGFLVLVGGYGMLWWSYECLTGRVPGTSDSNSWLPPLKDLFIPGRLAPKRLDGMFVAGGTAAQPLTGTAGEIARQGGQDPNAVIGSQPIPQNDTFLNPVTHA